MHKDIVVFGTIILLLAGVTWFFVWLIFFQPRTEPAIEAPVAAPNRDVQYQREYGYDLEAAQTLTLQLQELIKQYASANEAQRREMLPSMESIAEQRKNELVLLVEQNPQEFFRLELSNDLKQQAPEAAQDSVERQVSYEGALTTYEVGEGDTGKAITIRILSTAEGEFAVFAAENRESLEQISSGGRVRVEGLLLGDVLVIRNAQADVHVLL